MNSRLAHIQLGNGKALALAKAYRMECKPFDRRDLAQRQQASPYFGILPCRAGDIDFVMFHAYDDVVARDYLWLGADGYEGDIVRTWVDWCRSPSVVLDIGAYSGLMSILAARANTENEVHLFEPMERTVERANVNVKLNGLGPRIKRHAVAVSDSTGTAEICLYRDADFLGTGNSIGAKDGLKVVDTTTIRAVRLDEYMPDVAPSVVKIDVEGHELACLQGMRGAIERGRPKIIVEVWGRTRIEVLSLLNGLDYECTRIEDVAKGVENYLALPAELSTSAEANTQGEVAREF